jgi:hypothetical protein
MGVAFECVMRLKLMRQLPERLRYAGFSEVIGQDAGTPDAGRVRDYARSILRLTAPANGCAIPGGCAPSRESAVRKIRLIAVALAFFQAGASLTKCEPSRIEAAGPERYTRAMVEDSIVADSALRLGHWDRLSARHPGKLPASLRKHSRRPSPSDDDGTSQDPSDDDELTDLVIESDDGESVIAIWSPPMLCFVITSEPCFSAFPPTTATPLYLAQQRFRC